MKQLKQWFIHRFSPLQQLLIIGGLARLVSAIFSKGFGWSDDHFLIIETSASWADGYFNFWLPTDAEPNRVPQGHALFYIGLHYYFFKFVNWLGLADPQLKMLLIRLLHAAWSLLIITYGYKIVDRYAGKKAAWYAGLFLALYWFMPFVSVRNLVEFVCIPPCLIAIYLLGKENARPRDYLLAGIWLGIAFSIRFQSVFITAGIGLALMLMRRPLLQVVYLALSFFFVIFLTQGLVDIIIWKKPFTEFRTYVQYNLDNATTYGTDVWHMYFDLILGLLIPPLSFALVAGYFYAWRRAALLFWPVFLYLAFHIYFPNKQERFVMTVLPLIIISGTIGMRILYERYGSRLNSNLLKWSAYFVFFINIPALIVLSLSYSKRHRVESMYYLYKKGDVRQVWFEDSNKERDYLAPPNFYLGKWQFNIGITKTFNADSALAEYTKRSPEFRPNYFVFWQGENINARVDSLKKRFPGLTYEATIDASLIDKTLYYLNPLNDNQTTYIYKLNETQTVNGKK